MNSKGTKLLTKLVEQFHQKHRRYPSRIQVDPLALVILAYRRDMAPAWKGIPVYCAEIEIKKPQGEIDSLGVVLLDDGIQAVDLSLNCPPTDSGGAPECAP